MKDLVNDYGVVDEGSDLAYAVKDGMNELMAKIKPELDKVPLRDIRTINSYVEGWLQIMLSEYVLVRQIKAKRADREAGKGRAK